MAHARRRRALAPRKSKQSSTVLVRNIRRVMRDLLTGFGLDATLAQLEERGRIIASKMSQDQKKLLEDDLQELRDAHEAGPSTLRSLHRTTKASRGRGARMTDLGAQACNLDAVFGLLHERPPDRRMV